MAATSATVWTILLFCPTRLLLATPLLYFVLFDNIHQQNAVSPTIPALPAAQVAFLLFGVLCTMLTLTGLATTCAITARDVNWDTSLNTDFALEQRAVIALGAFSRFLVGVIGTVACAMALHEESRTEHFWTIIGLAVSAT
jgi:hypothetical protein